MDTKKINEVMRTVKSVAKKSTKVVAAVLPIGTVIVNGIDSYESWPNNPKKALMHFIGKYNGVDPETGVFSADRAMKGTGALILSGIAGWVINQVV